MPGTIILCITFFIFDFCRYLSLLNFQFSSCLKEESPISLLCNTLLNAGTPKTVQSDTINAILSLLKAEKEDDEGVSTELTFPSLLQKPLLECENSNGNNFFIILEYNFLILLIIC